MPKSEEMYNGSFGISGGPRTWVPRWMALAGYPPFAKLEAAEVSQKSAGWSGEKDSDEDLNHVIGAQLSRADLRFVSASHAFLAGADLSHADLSAADLRNADLCKANLEGANLSQVYLSDANLRGANIADATLYLTDFMFADLRGANLLKADMVDSDLNRADLRDAFLVRAKLASADLREANLGDANLESAALNTANLSYANLVSAKNLDPEQIKRGSNWEKAFYDDATLKVLGLPPDHNQKLAEEYPKENPFGGVLPWLSPSAPNR